MEWNELVEKCAEEVVRGIGEYVWNNDPDCTAEPEAMAEMLLEDFLRDLGDALHETAMPRFIDAYAPQRRG